MIRAAAAGAAGLLGLGLSAAWITSSADAAPENRPELGVYVGNTPDDVAKFETFIGSPVDAVLGYTGDRSWEDADPGWFINLWAPTKHKVLWSIPMTPKGTGAQAFREAAAGQHDAQYTHWAQEILDSRSGDDGPIYVRSTWELGGEWFEWTQAAKDDPQAYIGAWQHFAGDFHAVSPRFKMVWDYSGDRGNLESFYPGDSAIDVISQDAYWQPQYTSTDPAKAFATQASGWARGLDWMADFARQHGKRVSISEWGAAGNDAGPYIRAMQKWITTHDVAYATYWNGGEGSGYDSEQMSGRWPQAAQTLRDLFALPGQPGTGSPQPAPPPSPTATDSPTASPTATDSPTESPTATDSPTGSLTPTDSPTGSPTGTASPTPTDSPTGTGTAQPSPPASVTRSIGHGPRRLVLKISQDAYQGDARYLVRVDGRRVGGVQTAVASHGRGADDTLVVRGRWTGGPHTVTVTFLNDSYGGTPDSDRNLYVDGITLDGNAVADGSAVLYAAGDRTFALD